MIELSSMMLSSSSVQSGAPLTEVQFRPAANVIPAQYIAAGTIEIDAVKNVAQLVVLDYVAARLKQDAGIFARQITA